MGVIIRPPQEGDQAYVCATWMASARLEPDVVNRALDALGTKLLVAAQLRDPTRIIGWIAWQGEGRARVLHYLYVREGRGGNYRRNGVGRELFAAAGFDPKALIVYTCKGPDAATLLEKYNATHMDMEEIL